MDFPLEIPEGMQLGQHLNFSHLRPIVDLSPEQEDNKFMLF